MALDFQQIHNQVEKLGEQAPERWQELQDKRRQAFDRFEEFAQHTDEMRYRLQRAIDQGGKFRCALPADEPIDGHFPAPDPPESAEIIAADGSQVLPDRHAEILYYVINVGAIHYRLGENVAPKKRTESRLAYDRELYTDWGMIRSDDISLLRDVREREYLVETGEQVCQQVDCADLVITMTDGPVELWGVRDARGDEPSRYKRELEKYLQALNRMKRSGMIGCGYIDKPLADLVVRMLEISLLDEDQLDRVNRERPYRGVSDLEIFTELLAPGERSAVYRLHSLSAEDFTGDFGLYFFYINVGRPASPWIARVEIPRWVISDPVKINALHAVLLQQCAVLGSRPYPYLLHRAHEEARVTPDEKKELTQMIVNELRRRGIKVGQRSKKQEVKDSGGRTRYHR